MLRATAIASSLDTITNTSSANMRTSTELDKIAPALLAAQTEIGNATKNAKNPHFRNNYADLGAVIEAVKPVFNRHQIAVVQSLSDSTYGLTLSTRLIHSSGQWIEDTAYAPLPKADPQGVGSATTYLRRYSLAAFGCITQEDDDGEGARPKPQETKAPEPKEELSRETLAILAGISLEQEERFKKALAFYKVDDFHKLTNSQAQTIIQKLSK